MEQVRVYASKFFYKPDVGDIITSETELFYDPVFYIDEECGFFTYMLMNYPCVHINKDPLLIQKWLHDNIEDSHDYFLFSEFYDSYTLVWFTSELAANMFYIVFGGKYYSKTS